MSNPSAAILVIGDEILSGRTRDSNLHYLSCELTKIGINLQEARIIPDNATEIINAVKWLSSKYNYLFTSGGIGPTHDDITADCIAAAFETEINIREDAFKLLIGIKGLGGIYTNHGQSAVIDQLEEGIANKWQSITLKNYIAFGRPKNADKEPVTGHPAQRVWKDGGFVD